MKYPIYLDCNATTPLDQRVWEVMAPVYREHFGNPASQTHAYGWYAAELVEQAREQVAALVGAAAPEIVFTSGATESNNLALQGVCRAAAGRGGYSKIYIVSARTEHRSVLEPLGEIAAAGGQVHYVELNPDGTLKFESLAALIDQTPKDSVLIVSLMAANNEIGALHPLPRIAELKRRRPFILHSDATQAAGKLPLAVSDLGVDLLSFSAHKLYGPKGAGALYVNRGNRALELAPLLLGGGHEQGLRAGTLNVPAIAGFGKAAELAKAEREQNAALIRDLAEQLLGHLRESLGSVHLNGPAENRLPGNLNLTFPGVESSRLLAEVGAKIAISASSACSSGSTLGSHVLEAIGLSPERRRESVRIGVGRCNTAAEIEQTAELICAAVRKVREGG